MKYALTIINLILITIGAFSVVQSFYTVALSQVHIGSQPEMTTQVKGKNRNRSDEIKPISHYQPIASRNLFRIQSKADIQLAREQAPAVDDMEPTDLDLRLWGTVSTTKGTAFAVIASKPPGQRRVQQQLYHEGDAVLSAVIDTIYRDKVVLEVDGEQQVLKLEKYQNLRQGRKRLKRSVSKKPRKYTRTIRQAQIENAFDDISTIMQQARIRPHAKGVSISRIRSNSIFRKLGLRNGDIITGIDGAKISSVEDALSLYYGLQNGSRVTLDLERRRSPITITYNVQ
jgi:general secretion pathway protein C